MPAPAASRAAGALLHIASLPSGFGVGDLGPEAYAFADWLARAGFSTWQVLPLVPTDPFHGNSPYSSRAAFAGNPLLISPELLAEEGLLKPEELEPARMLPVGPAEYKKAAALRDGLLQTAFARFRSFGREAELREFRAANSYWLEDYSLFETIRFHRGGEPWMEWPRPLRDREDAALAGVSLDLAGEIEFRIFVQFCFGRQWEKLRLYCRSLGIDFFGDIPLYVDLNSADVWSRPEVFRLNRDRRARAVSGVPPDYFSRDGQLWGNPIYDWKYLASRGYDWWVGRLRHAGRFFDRVRLDHFRGFAAYWAVAPRARTARGGKWIPGPGAGLLKAILSGNPELDIVAEDLGLITDDVLELMRSFGLSGMKVLQFAFGPDISSNAHIPHNHSPGSVVYTGTHDNNTTRGWFEQETGGEDRARVFSYLGMRVAPEEIASQLIRLAFNSVGRLAVIPIQDILGLGAEARMNTPGLARGNWEWRLPPGRLGEREARDMRELVLQSGRFREGKT